MRYKKIIEALKSILYFLVVIAALNIFKEEIRAFEYYPVLIFTVFLIFLTAVTFGHYDRIVNKIFIITTYDLIRQVIISLWGLIWLLITFYYWHEMHAGRWISATIGIWGALNGLVHEASIQLYAENDELVIEYKHKGKYSFSHIDSYELVNGMLTIHSGDRKVEVYNIKMSQGNQELIHKYLSPMKYSLTKTETI